MSAHGAQSTTISAALSDMLEEARRWNIEDLERQKEDYHFEWDCVVHEAVLRRDLVEARSEWTEAAYHFDWEKLFRLALHSVWPYIDSPTKLINTTRLQRTKSITSGNGRPLSGFTALHQAAWHGAPVEVVQGLLDLGAYRWMRTTDGRNHLPLDLARLRGHSHLYDILEPPNYLPKWTQEDLKSIERHFHEVIEERTDVISSEVEIRLPNLEVLREVKGGMYMAVPGMHGGFGFELEGDHLMVDSTHRIFSGSFVTHHITPLGSTIARSWS